MDSTVVKRVVVIGASSGGIEALQVIAGGFSSDFPAAVCIVLHTSPDSPRMLTMILTRSGPLPVTYAETGMRLENGAIYIAPPDHHLLLEPGTLRLTRGPKENRFRPAIDPLFRSAAQVYGPAAIGVVLTGTLDDGTAGLWAIKRLGGIAIVQDPADALFPAMPANAARHVDVDFSVALAEIGPLLARVAGAPAEERREAMVPDPLEIEVRIAKEQNAVDAGLEEIAEPSSFSCPECHGVLLRLKDEHPLRFRCHTGHAFSADSLLAAVSEGIEEALWTSVRALEEAGLLMQHLADHYREHRDTSSAAGLEAQGVEARRQSNLVRQLVTVRSELTVPKA